MCFVFVVGLSLDIYFKPTFMRLRNIFAMFARALSFANISRPDSVFKCLWYITYFPHCLHLVCKNSSCHYIFSKSQNKFVANKNWFTVYVTVLIMMQGKTEKLSHFLHRANVNSETNIFVEFIFY